MENTRWNKVVQEPGASGCNGEQEIEIKKCLTAQRKVLTGQRAIGKVGALILEPARPLVRDQLGGLQAF